MPTPGQKAPEQREMGNAIANVLLGRSKEEILAYEIAELRSEIAKLREDLLPVPTLILTGRQALDEFKRLVHAIP